MTKKPMKMESKNVRIVKFALKEVAINLALICMMVLTIFPLISERTALATEYIELFKQKEEYQSQIRSSDETYTNVELIMNKMAHFKEAVERDQRMLEIIENEDAIDLKIFYIRLFWLLIILGGLIYRIAYRFKKNGMTSNTISEALN